MMRTFFIVFHIMLSVCSPVNGRMTEECCEIDYIINKITCICRCVLIICAFSIIRSSPGGTNEKHDTHEQVRVLRIPSRDWRRENLCGSHNTNCRVELNSRI
jgi:hypothetical protein